MGGLNFILVLTRQNVETLSSVEATSDVLTL